MAYQNPTETLTSKDIGAVSEANKEFGEDTSLIVARPGKPCCSFPFFWFTVPEGFYALVTKFGAHQDYADASGKKTPVWPSGLHFGPPWLEVSHLVTKQSMIFNTPVRDCKTKDNVTVQIDIAIILRVMGDDPSVRPGDDPANVYKFVHMVTARGLQQQLMDAQAEGVRTLARSVTHTEVFGLRSVSQEELSGVVPSMQKQRQPAPFASIMATPSLPPPSLPPLGNIQEFGEEEKAQEEMKEEEKDLVGDHDEIDALEAGFHTETGASVTEMMRARLNHQFQPQGIEIQDVIIQQITLPSEISSQMSQKTMVISQNAEQRMQQKYDMQSLTHTEAIKTLQQTQQETKMELIKDGEFEALQEQMKLDCTMAEGSRTLETIRTQMIVDVEVVNSESALTVARIRDTTRLQEREIIEKAEADEALVRAEAEAKRKEIAANAELKCAELQAKADKALFNAEGVSAPMIRTLNEHIVSQRKLKAQEQLASNEQLIVTGNTGGDAANQLILADAALRDAARHGKVTPHERSAILSELAVASGQAEVRLNVFTDAPPAPVPMRRR